MTNEKCICEIHKKHKLCHGDCPCNDGEIGGRRVW